MRKIRNTIFILCNLLLLSCTEMNIPPEGEYIFSRISPTEISGISYDSAIAGGLITDEGLAAVISRGVCWDTLPGPTLEDNFTEDGSGTGSFVSIPTGLKAATVYYLRAYATNDIGTAYAGEKVFKTNYGIVFDVDGNPYNTIKIGEQVWTKENLKATHYSNGDPVANVEDYTTWATYSSGAYCNYDNDIAKGKQYGLLYNWYTVNDNRGICPSGWHVPGDEEWKSLSDYLGGDQLAGYFIKQVGINSDESSFSGLLTGIRLTNGNFSNKDESSEWWSGTNLISRSVSKFSNVLNRWEYSSNGSKLGLNLRCLKGVLSEISTNIITNITDSSAASGGVIIHNEGYTITAKGLCWNKDRKYYPTIADNLTNEGAGEGNFTSNMTDLDEGTTYYVRAYLTNSSGTLYGNVVSFTTSGKPTIQTTGISSITSATAKISGLISSDGGFLIDSCGVCWSLKENPTIDDTLKITDIRSGNFSIDISGLQPDSVYYVRTFASNDLGTSYGNLLSFKTKPLILITAYIKSISSYSAIMTYYITENVGDAISSHGVCWSTSPDPVQGDIHTEEGSGSGRFESSISGLAGGTRYYVRAYTVNSHGITYSNEVTFQTIAGLADINKSLILSINSNSVKIRYSISSDGGSDIYARGLCWGTMPGLTISDQHTDEGSDAGSYVSLINSLIPGKQYYVRAYASNLEGVAYSDEVSFLTLTNDHISDIDGNDYHVIQIGEQVWMQENLKTTRFLNGDPIPIVTDNSIWSTLVTGSYCWYNNDITNKDKYGALYNFYSVADTRKICPSGWHVPSKAEWDILIDYLGRYSLAAYSLALTGSNSSRFSAIYLGYRDTNGLVFGINSAYFWTATSSLTWAQAVSLSCYYSCQLYIFGPGKTIGNSVRCIKD